MMLLALGSACHGASPAASPTPPSPTGGRVTATPPTTSPTAASCAERVLAGMTDEQRVGQLFLLGLADDRLGPEEADAIESNHFGSVWFTETTEAGADVVRSVVDSVQALAGPDTTAGVGFFVAANQEGGRIQALQGPGFSTIPTAVSQGRLATDSLASDARTWGRELASAGVDLNFAPVMDVVPAGTADQNQPIGVLERDYGDDPAAVGAAGAAFIEGMRRSGVATTAKHFPGLGRVRGNTDFTAAVVDDVTEPDDPDLGSFAQAIDSGVPFVMVALATYTRIDPDHLAAFSPVVMGILRDRLGFDGVIMSDDLGNTAAVAGIPAGQRGVAFIAAGGDMIISKTIGPAVAMATAILNRVRDDTAFGRRVDDAVLRILEAKRARGLLACG